MSDAAPPLADGRYRLISVLGVGGMATVYTAFDGRLQVPRAIKILSPELGQRRSLRSRFEGEASTMALLEHPNIVRVYDVGADGDRAYIVMELVDGGSLLDRVKRGGCLPAKLALRVTIDMLDALDVAHKRGVVHRDIKPHNILLSSDGKLRITDFGIARMRNDEDDGMTKTGAVMGTWGFMAPEQRVDAKSVDVRADLYSVGATLYSILTGKTPVDLFVADMDSSLLAGIDPELAEIIKKSTRYDRQERYASSAEMAQACRAILSLIPEDPPDTPPMFAPPDDPSLQRLSRGGGTGLLGPSTPPQAPAPSGPKRVPGPSTAQPALETMVPDYEEPAAPPPTLPKPAPPSPETADSGMTLAEDPGLSQPPEKAGPPWGVVLGGGALLLAAIGLGMQLLGKDNTEPVTDPDPVVQVGPAVDPVVDPPEVTDPVGEVNDPEVKGHVVQDPVVKDPVIKDPVVKPPPVKDPVVKDTVVVSSGLSHSKPGSAKVGSPLTLKVTAPSSDYAVTLYYRASGAGSKYTARSMRGSGKTFSSQITPDAGFAGGLEYYIQAKPTAGGDLLKKGSGFSPLKVPVR